MQAIFSFWVNWEKWNFGLLFFIFGCVIWTGVKNHLHFSLYLIFWYLNIDLMFYMFTVSINYNFWSVDQEFWDFSSIKYISHNTTKYSRNVHNVKYYWQQVKYCSWHSLPAILINYKNRLKLSLFPNSLFIGWNPHVE